MNRSLVAVALLLTLAGCSQEVPSRAPAAITADAATVQAAPAAPSGTTEAPANAVEQPPTAEQLREFSVDVKEVDCSAGPVAIATAHWDVSGRKLADIAIYVDSPDNEPKLWLESGATGEATTGKWVFERSRFSLRDRNSGAVLATRSISSLACPP